jgi:quinol monooxygenase YgiN
MFGTIARMVVQPGMEREFLAIGEQWTRERGASTGLVAEYVFQMEGRPRECFMVAIFADRETYNMNAKDPETDRWYQRMRATLEADPEWNDGEIIQSQLLGGI